MGELAHQATKAHERYMRCCLEQAKLAANAGEVPVGACVVLNDKIIGMAANACIGMNDPSAHAEILALRMAAQTIENYRLGGAWLYVTVEPCTMCAGALVHARIAGLVFGAREPRAGAIASTAAVLDNPALNHKPAWYEGVLAQSASELMQDFFSARRRLH